MNQLLSFNLSPTTLTLAELLPFVFFGYRFRYWYNPPLLKRYDFLLTVAAILLGTIILLNAAGPAHRSDLAYTKFAFLHALPIGLIFLLVRWGAPRSAPAAATTSAAGGGDTDYNPVPINNAVEQVSWDDLVIEPKLREELITILRLLGDPTTAKRYGIEVPKGILLNGPPGTGKTTIAKVIASTAGMAFFALKADEVISKWVGESEKNLARLFQAAGRHAPAIIFIDEIDAIGKNRSGQYQWADNVVNQLLQLMDGVVRSEGLYVIAATNRADLVDEALKRPGRFSRTIEIGLPDRNARAQLFSVYLSKLSLSETVQIDELAGMTDGLSGADIKEICNQAGLNAFKRESGSKRRNFVVTGDDVRGALQRYLQAA